MNVLVGLMMVAATVPDAPVFGLIATGIATALVLGSVWSRTAATGAVVATIVALAVDNPSLLLAAVSGLSAILFLLLSFGGASLVSLTGALLFTGVTMLVSLAPVELPWVPVAAPVVVVALFAVAVWPYASVSTTSARAGASSRSGTVTATSNWLLSRQTRQRNDSPG
jgi:hypothetical protein